MKRKLATEALYSQSRHGQTGHTQHPCHVESMERVTKEDIERVDPHGDRARALLKKFAKKS